MRALGLLALVVAATLGFARTGQAYACATSGVEIFLSPLGPDLWDMTIESDRALTDGAFDLNQGSASMAYTTAAPCDGVVAICDSFDESVTGLPALVFTIVGVTPTDPTLFTGIGNPVSLGVLTTTGPIVLSDFGIATATAVLGSGGFNMGTAPLTFANAGFCTPGCSVPGGPDFDGDGICDADDSCPTVVDIGDADSDGVDDACDTCQNVANPPFAGSLFGRTTISGQLDDDVDGVGNRCDFCYDQFGLLMSPVDFGHIRDTVAGFFPLVSGTNCGSDPLNPLTNICGQYDHDEIGVVISPVDFGIARDKVAEPFPLNGQGCGSPCLNTGPYSSPTTLVSGRAVCEGTNCP